MPRNGAGVYSLPAGNPVSPNTLIEAAWANSTLNDVAAEITNSLARNGAGGMTGPLRLPDGIVTAPAVAFNLETSTGLYRAGTGRLGLATLGVQRFAISGSDATFSVPVVASGDLTVGGNVTVSGTFSGNGSGLTSLNASSISSGTLADARLSSNVALRNAANTFTANQMVTGSSGIALAVNGVAGQFAALFNGGTAGSGSLAGIDVRGSAPGYVVSAFRNLNASGSTSVEVIGAGGAVTAFIEVNSGGTVGFGSGTNTPVHLYSSAVSRIVISASGNVTINAPTSGSHTINGNVSFGGTISGNGSGLTSLNASQLTSGTIPDARFPATLPAISGANLTSLNASQLTSGTIPDARFPATLPAISGANLTSLNASQLTSGTIPDARFPATLPAISGANLTSLNASQLTSGTIPDARFPATLPAISGANLTNLNASNISSGTLADARLSSNVALRNAVNTFTIGQEVASASNPLWQTRDTGNTSLGTLRHLDSGGYVGDISFYSSAHPTKPGWVVYNSATRHSFSLGGTEQVYITSNGNVTINAPSIGTALAVNGRALAVPVSVSFSTTPTFNSAQSNVIYFGTMTGNVTSVTISNPVDGAQLQIRFVQDGTGGRTVTLPSSVQVSGSLNTAANAVTWLVLTYVSSASRWEGTWTRVS